MPVSLKRQPLLARRGVLVANLALMALAIWGVVGEAVRSRATDREIARLEEQARELEAKNFEITRLGQQFLGNAAVEREARVNLGLQRPGESVIIVREPERRVEAVATPPDQPAKPESNLARWWQLFFKVKR